MNKECDERYDKYKKVINIAWSYKEEARARHFHPKGFLMGFSLFYNLRYFTKEISPYVMDDSTNGHETLFGLPIKLTENDRWGLSLEVEEFSVDLKEMLDEQSV